MYQRKPTESIIKAVPKQRPKNFGTQIKTSSLDGHGVVSSLHSTWRTKANNKPLTVTRTGNLHD